jgi:hypothetical protein
MTNDIAEEMSADTSTIWKHHVSVADTPEGFTLRTTCPNNADGVEVMLERWQAGSEEPPHSRCQIYRGM